MNGQRYGKHAQVVPHTNMQGIPDSSMGLPSLTTSNQTTPDLLNKTSKLPNLGGLRSPLGNPNQNTNCNLPTASHENLNFNYQNEYLQDESMSALEDVTGRFIKYRGAAPNIGGPGGQLSGGRIISIEEEEDTFDDFKLPPIRANRLSLGATNNYYKKDKLKMARQIAK